MLRRRAAEVRLATAHARRLEEAALELQAAEEEAALVRRRPQRAEQAVRRKADRETHRSAGGLYAGQRRSPNRPTHVDVDEQAWAPLKARAARRRETVASSLATWSPTPPTAAFHLSERLNATLNGAHKEAFSAPGTGAARAVGLVVEHEARRLGWRPETGK